MFDLLILNDCLLVKATPQQKEYLFEIMEGRNDLHSTIFVSLTWTNIWQNYLGEVTIADAVLDRITFSYTIYIKGNQWMRTRKWKKLVQKKLVMIVSSLALCQHWRVLLFYWIDVAKSLKYSTELHRSWIFF